MCHAAEIETAFITNFEDDLGQDVCPESLYIHLSLSEASRIQGKGIGRFFLLLFPICLLLLPAYNASFLSREHLYLYRVQLIPNLPLA